MSLSDPKTLMKDNMLLLQDAERERKARRIVDKVLHDTLLERDFLLETRQIMSGMVRAFSEVLVKLPHPQVDMHPLSGESCAVCDLASIHRKMANVLKAFPVDQYGNCRACGGGYEGSIPHTPECKYGERS